MITHENVVICGGREWATKIVNGKRVLDLESEEYDRLRSILNKTFEKHDKYTTCIITGGATGADAAAHYWAKTAGFQATEVLADWKKHGKSAGPKRNQFMLDVYMPDFVIAFPGGNGTEDMMNRTRKRKIPLYIVPRNRIYNDWPETSKERQRSSAS